MTTAEKVVRIEAEALGRLADRIAGPMATDFSRALELILCCAGRVVVSGMGKSGLIGRKLAATFASTGTPALYLHPAEALHGDLGMVMRGDLVLALSASGETTEILELLPTIKRLGVPLITFTGDCLHPTNGHPPSSLAQAADVALDCSIHKEACSLGLAPTASTTTMLALGDALAVVLSERRGFRAEDFADLHPGGKLGKRLARVSQLMHAGESIPRVSPTTPMIEVIYEMSRKGLGITAVTESDALIGIISDGDLRRLLEHRGKDVLDLTARQCMTGNPRTIGSGAFAAEALDLMEQKKITSLMVVGEGNRLEGVVHLHDLWGVELV
ncbi:MAG TPA: KpsF/GutQ family sugar-phosphate isomerase [Candidatus Saccharimonadales bacterium]|nr:KpsF/GutQ family sugar-phosphate isomerase [Candidatus Saccharimonadales bacterium]